MEAYLATKWGVPLGGGYTPLLSSPAGVPGCALWLDGADSSSTSNITTGTWYDKSGLSRTATSNSGASAFSMGTINNLPAVTFPSASATAFIAQAPITLSSTVGFSIFFVARWTAGSSDRVRFFCTQFNAGGTLDIELLGSNAAFPTTADLYGGTTSAGADLYGFTIPANTPFVYSTVFTSTATNGYSHWLNGVSGGSQTPAGAGAVNGMVIGNYTVPGAAYAFIGQMGEFLMFSNALNTTQRQSVERYLSLKWGLSNVYTSIPGSIPGLALWLDAADPAATGTGATCTTWLDKSTTGNNFTNVGGTCSNIMDGPNRVVQFPNTACMLSSSSITFTTSSAFYFVFKNTAFNVLNYVVDFPNIVTNAQQAGDFSIRFGSGTLYGANGATDANSLANGNYWINGIFNSYSGPYSGVYMMVGTLQPTVGGTSTIAISLPPATTSSNYSGRYFIGNFAEALFYPNGLNNSQREVIESYLAKKWGLMVPTQTLPVAHPFRSIKPYARRFSPIDIPGCKLWLDAYDDVTFTYSSGVIIQTWADKSGNGYNATQYGTGTTTYSATGLNSRPAVMFSASTTNMVCSIPAGTFPNGVTGFVVLAATNATPGVISRCVNNVPAPFDGSGGARINGDGNGYKVWNSTYTIGSTSAPFIYDFATSTGLVFTETVNGSKQTITFNYNDGNYGDNGTTVTIGTRQDRGWHTTGSYSEVILFDGVLTTAQRQQVDGYLAKKWNLQGNLPGTHSFATIPPTSALPFTPAGLPGCTIWLDGADVSTFIFSSGSNIASWRDKASGLYASNTTVGNQPSYAPASQNGLSTVFFDATAGLKRLDLPAFSFGTTSRSAFFVMKNIASTNFSGSVLGGYPHWFWDRASGNNPNVWTPVGWVQLRAADVNGNLGFYAYELPRNQYIIYEIMYSASTITTFQSGTQIQSIPTISAFYDATNGYCLGGLNNGDDSAPYPYRLYGNIAEVILFNTGLNSGQRQQIEGYLANKWGFQGSLPVAHPYYKIQPALRGQSIDFYESFENPAIPAPYSWAYSPSWNNWIWGGGGISGAGGSPWDSSPRVAAKGTRFAYIQGHSSYIQRAITPIPGYVATLSFSYSYRNETGRNSTFGVHVYAGGVLVGYFAVPNSFTAWTTVTVTYTMTSSSTNIQFMTYDPSGGDHSILVDNISLT